LSNEPKETVYQHDGLCVKFLQTEKGLWQLSLDPDPARPSRAPGLAYPPFQLAVAGRPHGMFSPSQLTGYTDLPSEMEMISAQSSPEEIRLSYRHAGLVLRVDVSMRLIPGAPVIRQVTTVANEGSSPVTITHLSTACFQGIAAGGIRPWHDPQKIRLHYCRQTWEGEGQWRSGDLEELGLYPNSVHPCASAVSFSSVGCYSTSRFLPLLVLEDLETGKVWYGQIETSSNWQIEVGQRGSWTEEAGALYLQLDAASERVGGWSRRLEAGESFASAPAAVGCCTGGFTEAIHELTKYRRTLKPAPAWQGAACPLVFNDYMNCLWGNPTLENLTPLIEAAAGVGAEVFCIDAGWFNDKGVSWGLGLGIWEPSKDRFSPAGLRGVLDLIRSKGMIPGLWLEMEVCSVESSLSQKPDDWFLRRNEQRVVGSVGRLFLNYTNSEVRAYIHSVIDRLVGLGAGYFKNDYNADPGNGDDVIGASAADGLLRNVRAFYNFIDEVRQRHPTLILENCGGGANREDYGILSHFHLQSSSDQEIYTNYPSILAGSLAGVLPEQLGIWAYPIPLVFMEMKDSNLVYTAEYRQRMADGEQTIFNMVNGLCGNMYLSGRIDAADDRNRALIGEGVEVYRRERAFIHRAFPFWPLGFNRLNEKDTWASVGLAAHDNRRALLAVWRLGSAKELQTLPLHGWTGRRASIRQIYPAQGYEVSTSYSSRDGTLTVRFPKQWTARTFEIKEIE